MCVRRVNAGSCQVTDITSGSPDARSGMLAGSLIPGQSETACTPIKGDKTRCLSLARPCCTVQQAASRCPGSDTVRRLTLDTPPSTLPAAGFTASGVIAMKHATIPLGLLIASAVLTACAAPGKTENYKILDEDDSTAEVVGEPYSMEEPPSPAEDTMSDVDEALSTEEISAEEVAVTDVGPKTPEDGLGDSVPDPAPDDDLSIATEDEVQHVTLAAKISPPAGNMDRSSWPSIKVGPASGQVKHNPIFFEDCPIHHPWGKIIDGDSLEVALEGGRAVNFDGTNLLNLITQPPKLGGDMVLAVFRGHRPWDVFTSP